MSAAQIKRFAIRAACLLASTVLTGDKIKTLPQLKERNALLKLVNKLESK